MALSPITQLPDTDHGSSVARPLDDVRDRALVQLYERRSSLNNLISALERYQREQAPLQGEASRP